MSKCANCYGYGKKPLGGGSGGYMTPYNSYTCNVCGGDGIYPKEREYSYEPNEREVSSVSESSGGGGSVIGGVIFVALLAWGYHAIGGQ